MGLIFGVKSPLGARPLSQATWATQSLEQGARGGEQRHPLLPQTARTAVVAGV